jgi:hypothetical protein
MKKRNRGEFADFAPIFMLVVVLFLVICRSCSNQGMTRSWGGEMDMYLDPNRKLVEVTWKDDSIWYLTKPMTDDDIAEEYEFAESSVMGLLEGTLRIHETKLDEDSKEYKDYLKWKSNYTESNYQDYIDYIDTEDSMPTQ